MIPRKNYPLLISKRDIRSCIKRGWLRSGFRYKNKKKNIWIQLIRKSLNSNGRFCLKNKKNKKKKKKGLSNPLMRKEKIVQLAMWRGLEGNRKPGNRNIANLKFRSSEIIKQCGSNKALWRKWIKFWEKLKKRKRKRN